MTNDITLQFCNWTLDDPDMNTYKTSCGHLWILEASTPEDNGMIYCPYCGSLLISNIPNGGDNE